MKNIRLILTSLLLVLFTCSLMAQNIQVKGTVSDGSTKEPLPYVTIQLKGTTQGTNSDDNGFYTMNVPSDATLIFSFVGYKPVEMAVNGKSVINVIMEPETEQLEDLIVIAYGTAKKSSFTGSSSLIKSDKIDAKPITTVTNALVGATSGVQVSTSNGQPGSSPSVYIRGLGSISASNTPLIVLDGMPYDNSISSINPNDIESLTVLKDAASSALYGSRAANGVLMITTKKGSKEKLKVNVKFNQGFTAKQSNDYKTVGLNDYVTLYWENLRNQYVRDGKSYEVAGQEAALNLFDNLTYNPFNVANNQVLNSNGEVNPNAKSKWADDTDWYNAIQRIGKRTDAAISISGGTEKSDYFASVGYTKEQGYIIGSDFKRYTARANVNSQITKFLKVGTNLSANMSSSNGNQNESSGNNINPFRFVRYIGPIYPIHLHNPETGEYLYDTNGDKIYDFGTGYSVGGVSVPLRDYVSGNNPAKELQERYDGYKRNTINGKVYAEISFLKDFKFTFNGGVGANAYLASSASIVYPEKGNTGNATKSNSFTTTWTFNELLTYNKDIGKHHVDVLVGHESYDYKYNYLSASMKDQKFYNNYELSNYTNVNTVPTSYTSSYATEGYLSRLNYDYDSKYFISGSFRRDGSSRFYKESRWGNFWSVGGGWRIDRENFMKNVKFVDMLKLRVSYGEVGNDDVGGYYPWRATYKNSQNAEEAGYIQSSLGNRDLQWEVSRNVDVALEFSFINRIKGSIELFNRQSDNLLFSIPLSPSAGITTQDMNAGTMYNRGIEFEITGNIFTKKNFTWDLSFNATHIENKITKLPVEPFKSGVHKVEEGHSRYEFWLRQWMGVDPATGSSLYLPEDEFLTTSQNLVEIDGNKYTTNIEEAKYAYSGKSMPKISGGISTNLAYKGFTLSLNFYYQLGGKMYDVVYSNLMSPGTGSLSYSTLHVDMLKRWQKPGDVTNVPRVSNGSDSKDLYAGSTRWLVSSNMLELTTINFGYKLPQKWVTKLGVTDLRLYCSAENMFQLTKRKGIYPRKNVFSGYSSNGDVYLPSRVFTFGLNISF